MYVFDEHDDPETISNGMYDNLKREKEASEKQGAWIILGMCILGTGVLFFDIEWVTVIASGIFPIGIPASILYLMKGGE